MGSAACASGGSERNARSRREPQPAARWAGAGGPADPAPVRQARPAAFHLPPGLRPGLRTGPAPGRGTDRVLPGLQPAPEGLLRQRRAHRGGQRGGVPGDRPPGPGAAGRAWGVWWARDPPVPPRATRLAQGTLTAQGEIADPLLADRTGAVTGAPPG